MSLTDLFSAQIADPFRIGLLVALFATMLRTQAATGILVPLAAGAVFVAIILPSTMGLPAGFGLVETIGVGAIANAAWLVVIFAAWQIFQRVRG